MGRNKPHKSADPGMVMLRNIVERSQKLSLSQFRRIKQLGSGDVGLVDLVELQGVADAR